MASRTHRYRHHSGADGSPFLRRMEKQGYYDQMNCENKFLIKV